MTTTDPNAVPSRRRRGTIADMVRSLGLVGLAVLVLLLVTVRQTPDRPYASPDVASTVAAARANAPYPVIAATSLPKGWYANYANFDATQGGSGHWYFHLGYVRHDDKGDRYLEVNGTNALNPENEVPSIPSGAKPVDRVTVDGVVFDIYASGAAKGVLEEMWFSKGTGTDGNPYILTIMSSLDRAALRAFAAQHLRTTGPVALNG